MKLEDTSLMPFGKYKDTPMQDVPASYLHWLYHNSEMYNAQGQALKEYIENSWNALKEETPDLLWAKK